MGLGGWVLTGIWVLVVVVAILNRRHRDPDEYVKLDAAKRREFLLMEARRDRPRNEV